MGRSVGIAVGMGLLLAAAAAGKDGGGGVAPGQVIYTSYCAACHGVAGEGDGPVAGALVTPPADLTRLAERYGMPLPRRRLAAFIDGREGVAAHGPREMPVWGEVFFEEDLDAGVESRKRRVIAVILDYLESIQRVRDAGRPRTSVAAARFR